MPEIPEGIKKKGFIILGAATFLGGSIYAANFFNLSSRLSECNMKIEKLLSLYSSPDIETILAKDASEAKELFDFLEKNNCKKNEFVKAKYKILYELIVKENDI